MSNLKYLFKKVPVDTSIEEYRKITLTRYISFIIYVVTAVGVLNAFSRGFVGEPELTPSNILSKKALGILIFNLVYMLILCIGATFLVKHQSAESLQKKKIKETDERMNSNDLQAIKLTFIILYLVGLGAFTYFNFVGHWKMALVIFIVMMGSAFLRSGIKSYLDKHS